jgi:tripartite ATP-independent transporter DctP family solute receptor
MTHRLRLGIATGAVLLALSGAAAAQTVLKIGYSTTRESHVGAGTTAFCDELEKRTERRYRCEQFPASALGGEREQVEAVQLGTQDMVNTSTGPLGNFVPEVGILDIPFLFRDYDHARRTLDGPIGQDLLQKMAAKGLIGLAWTENGFRHMTNSRRPIVTPADAAGLKLRTMENKVHMAAYRTFGLLPTPMAFPEVFTALQQGTVDGQENPIPIILAAKLAQVQKHLSLTGHVYSPSVFIVSPNLWNKLSAADRKAFVEAAGRGAVAQRRRVDSDEASGIAQLKKDGMQVVEKVDGAGFRKAVAPAYSEFAKQFGADRIAAIQSVN